MSWLAWGLMTVYALTPLAFLCGIALSGSWLMVMANLLFCVLVVRARGNVSKILS